ncbi:hypothetical protein WKK05_41010 (plasmid) [Nostoc sp. UHCC 0302]|uniref:hypothetical protein n=1 Tax=Nostoc sp. UHCC 0302 TaxID=3134896 RepID=UPI00311C8D33
MTQTRIVLNPKYKPKAEEILEATGIDNLSQLFTLLLVNYGDCLVNCLKHSHQVPIQSPTQPPTILPPSSPQKKKFAPMGSF